MGALDQGWLAHPAPWRTANRPGDDCPFPALLRRNPIPPRPEGRGILGETRLPHPPSLCVRWPREQLGRHRSIRSWSAKSSTGGSGPGKRTSKVRDHPRRWHFAEGNGPAERPDVAAGRTRPGGDCLLRRRPLSEQRAVPRVMASQLWRDLLEEQGLAVEQVETLKVPTADRSASCRNANPPVAVNPKRPRGAEERRW